ncbi:MAG: M42 family peptidase, partial [Elusimicrobiota bacterium]|nr:M42 family peptidase [Elusimicrobiota bacterium]
MEQLLKDLLLSDGTAGFEENIGALISKEFAKTCDSVETDNIGNVIGKKGKGKKKIMIDAHMDEIGFAVKYISEKGYIYFIKI